MKPVLIVLLLTALALPGCAGNPFVPRDIRLAQAAATDDRTLTLSEIDAAMSAATQPADQLATARRAIECLRRTQRTDWIVRCWMDWADPRESAKAKP